MGNGPLKTFSLKVLTTSNQHLALAVARALPDWFTTAMIQQMSLDLVYQRGALAMDGDNPIGFISFFVNRGKAEIAWMGVISEHQNHGVGKFILNKLITELRTAGISEVLVRTLGESVDHELYTHTRAFFRSVGFQDLKIIPNPENSEYEEELVLLMKL